MNFALLLPALVQLLSSLGSTFGTAVPPVAGPRTSVPVPAAAADQAIKDLQTLLNSPVLGLSPPLVVDGFLGPKTDAAIEAGIAKLKAAGVG